MNTINKIFLGLGAVALFASCNPNNTPKFAEEDSFVAFAKSSLSCNEEGGVLKVPVTVASIDPVKTTVTYSVLPTPTDDSGKDLDGYAAEGVNFDLVDKSAVLQFDGKTREAYIEVDIKNIDGFTGDLLFSLKLEKAGSLNLGKKNVCTVKILDKDHPLSAILGEYTANATTIDDGDISWTVILDKVEGNVKAVNIFNISPYYATAFRPYPKYKNNFVGNVVYETVKNAQGVDEQQLTAINIPIGQSAPAENNYKNLPIVIGEATISDAGVSVNIESGNIVCKTVAGGFQIDQALTVFIPTAGWIDVILPNTMTLTKK